MGIVGGSVGSSAGSTQATRGTLVHPSCALRFDDFTLGEKYVARHCGGDWFVQTRQTPCRNVACNRAVAIKYKDDVVIIHQSGEARNTVYMVTPKPLTSGTVVTKGGTGSFPSFTVTHPNGARVNVKLRYWRGGDVWNLNPTLYAPGEYYDGIDGMCGSWNDDQSDDPDHQDGGSNPAFQVPAEESIFSGGTPTSLGGCPEVPGDPKPVELSTPAPLVCDEDGEEVPPDPDTVYEPPIDPEPLDPIEEFDDPDPFECDEDALFEDGDPCEPMKPNVGQVALDCVEKGTAPLTTAEITEEYNVCVEEVKLMCDRDFAVAAVDVMKERCVIPEDPDECPNFCNFAGTCKGGVCACEDGAFGPDCGIPAGTPLTITAKQCKRLLYRNDVLVGKMAVELIGRDFLEGTLGWRFWRGSAFCNAWGRFGLLWVGGRVGMGKWGLFEGKTVRLTSPVPFNHCPDDGVSCSVLLKDGSYEEVQATFISSFMLSCEMPFKSDPSGAFTVSATSRTIEYAKGASDLVCIPVGDQCADSGDIKTLDDGDCLVRRALFRGLDGLGRAFGLLAVGVQSTTATKVQLTNSQRSLYVQWTCDGGGDPFLCCRKNGKGRWVDCMGGSGEQASLTSPNRP